MSEHRSIARTWRMVASVLMICGPVVAHAAEPARIPPANSPGSAAAVLEREPRYPELPRMDLDAYGGWTGLSGKATGFFHTEKIGNRWWLITPEGHAFYSLGMVGVPDKDLATFKSWGFNTLDQSATLPDANRHMPYTIEVKFLRLGKDLPIARAAGLPPWVSFPDVFDPEWVRKCHEHAQQVLAPFAKDPWLIGYFIDNEPSFGGWYEAVTRVPKDASYRKAFVEVARKYYADKPDQLAKDWKGRNVTRVDDLLNVEGEAPALPELAAVWQEAVAEQAFGTMEAAARKADPNHLNLGIRMINASPPPPGVFAAMGRHVDVVSLNLYSLFSDRLLTQMFTLLPAIHSLSGKPIMTSEFTFRGGDTRCPNTIGAPPTVPTQADRAVGYLSYLAAVASLPFHVGVCWYKYQDDGLDLPWGQYAEDCNFGAVDGYGRPYAALTSTMRQVNGSIYELAADPVANPKCPLFYRTELRRWDRDWDQQMLMRFGQMAAPPADPLSAQLPEPRRYHEHYWISHHSPKLTINEDQYYGWGSANMLRTFDDGQELTLLGLKGFLSLPRAAWLGPQCDNPVQPYAIESNAQMLIRRLDAQGRVRRMTMIDGSYVLAEFNRFLIRADGKVPYLDLQFDPETKKLAIDSQGQVRHIGISDVTGWQAVWNGYPAPAVTLPEAPGISAFAYPTLPPPAATVTSRKGATFHVSKLGDNSDGSSWQKAFHTIQQGLSAIPDDKGSHRVLVRPDTYREANLAPSFTGAASAYNALIGDSTGELGSGAKGWVLIDSSDPAKGFKSWDWWSTFAASDRNWPTGNNSKTFSSLICDRWVFRNLYVAGGDAGLFWDLTDKSGQGFTVIVEDCVGTGRAFGGGVCYPTVRADEPSVFRRCYFLALDYVGDTAAVLLGGWEKSMPDKPHAVFEDCTFVHPDNAVAISYASYCARAKFTGCRLIALNFTQPEMGGKSTGIICTQGHRPEGRLHVDLEDCTLAGYSIFTPGDDAKAASWTTKGKVRAYVQFKQPDVEGFERIGGWPADLFAQIAPPRLDGGLSGQTKEK